MGDYCPFCKFQRIVTHLDGSKTCTKCHIRYRIEVEKEKDFLYDSEEWFDIKGFEGRYAVSNYLRILRKEYDVWNRHEPERMLRTYPKNSELYISLYKAGKPKEYNVRKLYQEASRACMEEDASDFCGVDDV